MTSEQYKTLADALSDLSKFPPRMQAYLRLKARHTDILIFLKMGNFYEVFFDDAEEAACLLNTPLTSRQFGESSIKMAGVSYHMPTRQWSPPHKESRNERNH